jgi:hypothetical protein
MSEERGVLLTLPGTITDYFLLEYQCGHLPSARLYKALDRTNRVSVGLWVTRRALSPSEAAGFSHQLEEFRGKLGTSEIRSFGVDTHGVGFVALSNLDGVKINAEPADARERERRYLMCVRAVARMHDAGLVSGTICSESFFMNRNGTVRFVGMVPSVESGGEYTEVENAEYAPYRYSKADTSGCSPVDDVHALLVLGYRLFAGVYPTCSNGILPPVFSFNESRPTWVDELITPLLTAQRQDLPVSAGVFLERLKIFKDDQLSAQLAPVLVENDKVPQREQQDGVRQVKLSTALGESTEPHRMKSAWRHLSLRTRTAAIVAGASLFFAIIVGRAVFNSDSGQVSRLNALEAGPEDVAFVEVNGASWAEREEQLRKMFASDDPLAHDALLRKLRTVAESSERDFIVEGILSRCQRMGLVLSAEQVLIWKRKLGGPIPPGVFLERLLRIVDPLVPAGPRAQLLSELYGEQPALAMRLAFAAALDLGSSEPYRAILSRGARSAAVNKGSEKRSLFALALAVPDLANAFADAIRPHMSRIPDEDVAWLVTQLAFSNPTLASEMAESLIARQVVSGPRTLFLRELESATSMSVAVRTSLVNSAVSGPNRKDLSPLLTWNSPSAARALLVVVLTTEDAQLTTTAFEVAAARLSADPVMLPLMSAIRSAGEVNRSQVARVIAAVVLEKKLSDDEISKALAGIELSAEWDPVLRALIDAKSDRVVVELLRSHGEEVDPELLIEILKRGQPKMKIKAIEVVGQLKDGELKRLALELYPEEKDPDVIAAYDQQLKNQ